MFTALLTGRDYLSRVAGGRWRIPVSAVVATVVICVSAMELFALGKSYQLSATVAYKTVAGHQREYRLFFYTPAWQLHDTALDWLKSEANSDEIVATSTPHWVYLKCGLRAVMPPFENDVSAAQRLIDSVPVNYLILDNLQFVDITRRYGARTVQAFPECWELIYSTRGSGVPPRPLLRQGVAPTGFDPWYLTRRDQIRSPKHEIRNKFKFPIKYEISIVKD